MSSLMHVYGRGGDIVMAMSAALMVSEHNGEDPSICIAKDYINLAYALKNIGMPIDDIVECPIAPINCDYEMFGSSLYPMSDELLSSLFADYSKHYNCCLGSLPRDTHIARMMNYSTGIFDDISGSCKFPQIERSVKYHGRVIYHFGSSSPHRQIVLDECPFPNMESIVVGSEDDPGASWADIDMRGLSIDCVFNEMTSADACIGSDSLITHISSLMSVPTIAIHRVKQSMTSSSRDIYGNHAFSVFSQKGKSELIAVIVAILSRYFHELKN